VPFSAGNGELQIVAGQNIGSLGDAKGLPTTVQWKWYYNLPGLVFGVLALLPLVLARENWNFRAWAALVPLLVIIVLWNWMKLLFSPSSSTAEYFGVMIIALATAWTVFWSLAGRFQSRSKVLNFTAAAVVLWVMMSAVLAAGGVMQTSGLLSMLISQLVLIVAWLASMILSARRCRKTYSPKRFMAWLFLWTMLTLTGFTFVYMVVFILVFSSVSMAMIPRLLIGLLISSGLFGFILYLLNLPFMVLVFNNSIYDERFRKTFGLPMESNNPSELLASCGE